MLKIFFKYYFCLFVYSYSCLSPTFSVLLSPVLLLSLSERLCVYVAHRYKQRMTTVVNSVTGKPPASHGDVIGRKKLFFKITRKGVH